MGSSLEHLKSFRSDHHQFYLVIYTETDAHVNRYICGSGLDLGLNDKGIDEAKKLARRFHKNPLKFKRMIASPELRTIQMADILHDEMKAKLMLWREFGDQFMGEWEGKPILPTMDFKNPPQGETQDNFFMRVRNGLHKLLQEKDLVLVVTHLRVARTLLYWLGAGPSPNAVAANQKLEPGKMYCVDLPVDDGIAHFREV